MSQQQNEVVSTRWVALLLSVVVGLFPFRCLAAAEDNECTMSAFFVLPDGSSHLCAKGIAVLALKFTNSSKSVIHLDSLKPKGVEQLSETPMPSRQTGVLPCYLASVLVEFIDDKGKVVHRDSPALTVSGALKPNDDLTCLVSVRLPDSPGSFRVKLSSLTPAKVGKFAFQPDTKESSERNIASLVGLSAEIQTVRIAAAATSPVVR
jgi:hypothetical protein